MLFDPRARARFRRNRGAVVGVALVLVLVLFAVFGPMFAGDPFRSDFTFGISASQTPVGPNARFWLGADRIFRDEFARLAVGARLSLVIAVCATVIASLIGAVVGIVAGYYEGTDGVRLFPGGPSVNADSVLMRVVDVGLAFPFLLLVMAIGAALDRTTVTTILVTLGLTGWLGAARVLRAKTLQVKNLDFVVAARALGQSTPSILMRHILPNVAGPLIVLATISVAQMIVAESVLSYLGVGISPPTPTWGHMLFEGQDYYLAAPWMILAPGGAILVAVFGFNLLGEGLRDALDPQED